nr:right-handed parallel beta-helix repeat-containing protein [Massilia oculi]
MLCCAAVLALHACGGGDGGADDAKASAQAAAIEDDSAVDAVIVTGAASADEPEQLSTAHEGISVKDDGGAYAAEIAASSLPAPPPSVGAPEQSVPAQGDMAIEKAAQAAYDALADTQYQLYVASDGSDRNPGTKDLPFMSITKASRAAKPSTTIYVAPGTYRENVLTRPRTNAAGRVSFVSSTPGAAKIIGSGTGAAWTNRGNYVDIVGFDISGTGRIGIANLGSQTTISGNHVHDIKVSGGCTSAGGAGIVNADYAGSDADIIGNLVHDIGTPGSCNGVQGIYHSNKRGRIQNNVVYRASSFGIHLWHAATDVVISNNTTFQNGSKRMGGGIVIGAGDKPGKIVVNNTHVSNNIVVQNPRFGITQYCYRGQNCIGETNTVTNNLIYGNGVNLVMKVGKASGTIMADPQFVRYAPDSAAGNYGLKSTSPAIDRGMRAHAPLQDIVGIKRPRGGGVDLGAHESY